MDFDTVKDEVFKIMVNTNEPVAEDDIIRQISSNFEHDRLLMWTCSSLRALKFEGIIDCFGVFHNRYWRVIE